MEFPLGYRESLFSASLAHIFALGAITQKGVQIRTEQRIFTRQDALRSSLSGTAVSKLRKLLRSHSSSNTYLLFKGTLERRVRCSL